MRLRNAVAVLVTFSSVGFAAPTSSDELAEVRAQVYRSDRALTAPSRSSASAVAAGFLRSRGASEATVGSLSFPVPCGSFLLASPSFPRGSVLPEKP